MSLGVSKVLIVKITWMDGQTGTYRYHHATVEAGVLWLTNDRFPRSDEPDRRIPLANVRDWTVTE